MDQEYLKLLMYGNSPMVLPVEQGESHRNSVLTEDAVREIRSICDSDPNVRYADLAPRFGVSVTTIRKVATRHSWKHIP